MTLSYQNLCELRNAEVEFPPAEDVLVAVGASSFKEKNISSLRLN